MLGGRVRTILLLVLAALVVVLLVRPTSSSKVGDFSGLASQVNTTLTGETGVVQSSGGYLPGTGIVLVSSVSGVETSQLNQILSTALSPLADQLAELPGGEAISWQVATSSPAAEASTRLVRVAGVDVLDQTRWVVAAVPSGANAATATGSAAASGSAAAIGSAAPTTGSAAGTTAAASASGAAAAGSAAATGSAAPVTGSAAATTAAAPAAATTGATGTDSFSADASSWTPLTGTWKVKDGAYQQTDNSGFDFISQFKTTVPAAYTVSVKMHGLGDSLNAGLMIGQPKQGARQGATIVDLAGKDYLRWGTYDAGTGVYKFVGGKSVGVQDPATWHTIAVTVASAGTTVEWDGKKVGSFPAVSGGSVGLVTSQSAVEFDDMAVTAT
ncbi:MAG TPA: hypothetical protein VES60_13060 [Nakamurella sp.]|nr:hypothetical protein [Nakamurella sp.]